MNSKSNSAGPRTFTAAELLIKEFAPPRWAVPGILPAGVSLLAAKPKMGKSWLAYGLCIAVATGGVALGTRPVEKGEALYLALEDNERRLQRRLKMLLPGNVVPEGLHLATHWPGWDDGGVKELDAWVAGRPDARLVVIDTLKKVRPRAGGNHNMYDVDYEALAPLVPVAAEHNTAILVIHHNNQMVRPDDPFDAISGSTGLTGAVDGMLVMSRERGSADAILYVDGRDIEESEALALAWNPTLTSWTLKGDAEEYRMSPERRAVVQVIRLAGEPMRPKAVAEKLGKKPGASSVRKLMGDMVHDGQLCSDGGLYSLPGNSSNRSNSDNSGNFGNSADVTGVTRASKSGNASFPLVYGENSADVTGVTGKEETILKALGEMDKE